MGPPTPRSQFSPRGLRHGLVAVILLLGGCTGGSPGATPAPVADPLMERAERDGTVVVVVELPVPLGSASSYDTAAVARAQRKLMADLGPGARVVERFGRRVPRIVLRVTPEALQELRSSPHVLGISLMSSGDEAKQ